MEIIQCVVEEGRSGGSGCGGQPGDGTVRVTLIMIYFAKANTRCGSHAALQGWHFVFAIAMLIMIKVTLTVPQCARRSLCRLDVCSDRGFV